MKNADLFFEKFREPDRMFGVYQIIHGGAADLSRAELYDRRGFAGVVGNVPYTRDFPENGEAWEKIRDGLREYIRRGMHVWIYDEKGYPSGTAGGYVTENHPETVAKGLYCYDHWRIITGPSSYRADVPGDRLWKALLIPVGSADTPNGGDIPDDAEPIDVTDRLNENNVLYLDIPAGRYRLVMMSVRRLFDGTHATESYNEPRNYISLSDRHATELFIESTHENYRKVIGDEFGKGVRAVFTDEPSLISWNIRNAVFPILPWLDSYPADFEARFGYSFYKACVAVLTGKGKDVVSRRCDFWDFIADTVADGYFGTIREWCRRNGLKSSGHMLEEERLQAHIINYGSFFRAARKFDWPGIDQLGTVPSDLMDTECIPIARFLASFADLNGEREVFTEFSDHRVREHGMIAPISYYYASVNWHLAMGVNNFTSYYSWNGIDDDACVKFNRYTARCGWLLRQGIRDSRAAVFYPEAAMWASYTPTTERRARDWSEGTTGIDNAFAGSMWALLKGQTDCDCIDRKILTEARVEDRRLKWGDRSYAAVVMPCARVLEKDAAKKLIEANDAGVAVSFVEEIASALRETGKPSPETDEIAKRVADGRMTLVPSGKLAETLCAVLPEESRSIRLIPDVGSDGSMILSHVRMTGDGMRIVFLTNMAESGFSGSVAVTGEWSEALTADAATGDVCRTEWQKRSGASPAADIRISLAPWEAVFFLLS
ncbi:MAG: hypothetical protein J5940_06430 [Clostridia bacterium]|nr:hypothetical protein [Clostridia bacterium]